MYPSDGNVTTRKVISIMSNLLRMIKDCILCHQNACGRTLGFGAEMAWGQNRWVFMLLMLFSCHDAYVSVGVNSIAAL